MDRFNLIKIGRGWVPSYLSRPDEPRYRYTRSTGPRPLAEDQEGAGRDTGESATRSEEAHRIAEEALRIAKGESRKVWIGLALSGAAFLLSLTDLILGIS